MSHLLKLGKACDVFREHWMEGVQGPGNGHRPHVWWDRLRRAEPRTDHGFSGTITRSIVPVLNVDN